MPIWVSKVPLGPLQCNHPAPKLSTVHFNIFNLKKIKLVSFVFSGISFLFSANFCTVLFTTKILVLQLCKPQRFQKIKRFVSSDLP